TASGCEQLQLVFPADSASALMVDGGQGFASASAAGEFKTAALLLGDRATRCLVTLPEPGPLQGRILAGQYRLALRGPRCTLVLGFRRELAEARELLRNARAAAADGRPAAAFELVRDLVRRLPHDAEMLAQAQALRSELQAKAAEAVHGIST